MQGSQIIALLIGILLLIVTIGWLVFIWYRRHVSMGIMVSQARARVIRGRRRANYDLERGGQNGGYIPPPKYRSDAWQRPSTRLVPRDPKEPDYVILRRMNEEDDYYRTRAFRREYLSPADVDRRHPGSHADNEQLQAHQLNKEHQQQPQQQQKKGKKQKQKKGNQNGQDGQNGQNNQTKEKKQGNQNNHGSQNNRGNQKNQGGQTSNPPNGKKNKKGTNTDDNGEAHEQPQEDKQHNNNWENDNSGHDQQENNYGQQDSQIDPQNDDPWSQYNDQNNHQSNRGSDGWPTPPQNSRHSSNKGSQSDGNGKGQKSGRVSRREGVSRDNDTQKTKEYETTEW